MLHSLTGKTPVQFLHMPPGNNRRWHRNAGFALCALAACTGEKDQEWLLARLYQELNLITKWLPNDGTSHESATYMLFGLSHLALAVQASDYCLGTEYLKLPFFRNVVTYMLEIFAPGFDRLKWQRDSRRYGPLDSPLKNSDSVL